MSPPQFPGLPGLPKLPPLPGLGRGGNGPLNLGQALGQQFGGFMQSAPGRMLAGIFPGTNAGGQPAAAAAPHQTAGPAAPTPAPIGPPTIPLPGGASLAPPAVPFVGTPANAAPQTSTGLAAMPGNVLGAVANTLRTIVSPPGPAPSALPTSPPGLTGNAPPGLASAPGAPPGLANTPGAPPGLGNAPVAPPGLANAPGQLAALVPNVVRTVVNAMPIAPPTLTQVASPVTSQTAANPQQTAAGQLPNAQMQGPAQPQAPTSALPQSAAPPMQASVPAPQAMQAPAQSAATLSQSQAAPAPFSAQTQAQPTRADAAFAPPGNPAAERAVPSSPAQAPVQPNATAVVQGAAMLAAVPLATTVAQAPVVQQLAGNPQAQAPGNPVAGTAALDAGGPVRAELTGLGTYTADGPGLRRRDRMKVGAHAMAQWILAASQGRLHLVRPHDADTPREIAKVFQRLFWVLALVAYGCLGLVLVSFLLSFGELPSAPVMRRWTGEFAVSGLLAAVGAWWLGRQLTRAAKPPPDPIRR